MNIALGLVLVAALAPGACYAGQTLANGRLTVGLATAPDLNPDNNNRVDSFAWVNSAGVSTGNLAVNSSAITGLLCGDPLEFFGQAVGGPDDNAAPDLVVSGDNAPFTARGPSGGYTLKRSNSCGLSSAGVVSVYTLSTDPEADNELKVVRVFGFSPQTPVFTGGFRDIVPRVSNAVYTTDLIPNASGVVMKYDIVSCGEGCRITDWNGRWIAEDDSAGNGVVIIRSRRSLAPADAIIDTDAGSGSNASGIELIQPQGGWKSQVTEIEYLCAYDLASWPRQDRLIGKLPVGCKGP